MRHFLFIVHGAYFSSVTDLVARREFCIWQVCKRIIQALEVTVLIAAHPVMLGVQATINAPNPPWLIAPFQAYSTNGLH